jgi:excisionase family DNA binding protein
MQALAVGIPEACRLIGVGRSSVYALIREGRLTPKKIGKRTVLLVTELEAFVQNLPAAS